MSNKMGLALASGGARGAYQAGALLALAELGLRFHSIAGTSIGSLNGAFYCTGDGSVGHMEDLCRLWRATPDAGLIEVDPSAVAKTLIKLFGTTELPSVLRIMDKVTGKSTHLLDPRPVEAFLDKWINYDQVVSSEKTFLIAMIPASVMGMVTDPLRDIAEGAWRKAVYFRASTLKPEDVKNALLAASAIPLAFPPRKVKGKHYTDAGLSAPLPSQALRDEGCEYICSVFLSDTQIQNRADYPDTTLLQIRPTEDINPSLLTMLDFGRNAIERLIDLGYKDAHAALAEAQKLMDLFQKFSSSGQNLEELTESLGAKPRLVPWDQGITGKDELGILPPPPKP